MTRAITLERIFENDEWFSEKDFASVVSHTDTAQSNSLQTWELSRRVFSVVQNGYRYYARYQFDSYNRPLPVIKEILEAYGEFTDAWAVAAWFYFPNSWIVDESLHGHIPVAPKNALYRQADVINAARKRRGTYVS